MNYSVLLPYLCSWWTPYMYNAMSYWPNPPSSSPLMVSLLSFLFFLNVGEFPKKKTNTQKLQKKKKKKKKERWERCKVLQGGTGSCSSSSSSFSFFFFPSGDVAYPVNIICHFIKKQNTKKKISMLQQQSELWRISHHVIVFKCWVCVCACLRDRGRKGFVHA